MGGNERAALSPEMLLFEVAAMCSRHGLAVSSANPGAARHYAEQLMRALGLVSDAPAGAIASPAPDATAPIPVIRDGRFVDVRPDPRLGQTIGHGRGAHRVSRPLAAVRDDH